MPGRVEHRLPTSRLDLVVPTRTVEKVGHGTRLVDDNARNGRHMASSGLATLEKCALVKDKTVGEESGLREENRKMDQLLAVVRVLFW